MKKQWNTPTLEVLDVKKTFDPGNGNGTDPCSGPAGQPGRNPHCTQPTPS